MTLPRILLTGKNGQVGFELCRTLSPLGTITAVDVEDCDLTDPAAIERLVDEVRPDMIVNPAAYTAVDRAESEKEIAHAINATAPGILAAAAARRDALMVHFSTDYVFDGSGTAPYRESDPTNPVSAYGATKLAGEKAVQQSGARHLIFRLSWVYGTRGANFLLTMQRLANEREELNIVNDQIGSPTWCRTIAESVALILAQNQKAPITQNGIYHMSAASQTSWYDFAKSIFDLSPDKNKFKLKAVNPIPTSAYPTPAKRPAYSVLSNDSLTHTFGIRLPDWQTQLKQALEI
ncbi:MAG: dTDP-4-dehydrorhamnose reductase [Deltaproteobacteria bacterium]|nr:dTDP-4-dehydrorhamnose reductase [Deltaproteobacteria bacterium]